MVWSGKVNSRQNHCGETKHGRGRFDVVTKGDHDERQVGSAGVRSDSAGDHRSNPSRQAAIPRKQHARQPVVSATAARGRNPRPRQVGAGPPAQEEAPKELADVNKEAWKLTTRLKAIERRRAELMKELAG